MKPYLPDWSYAGYHWGDKSYVAPLHIIGMATHQALPKLRLPYTKTQGECAVTKLR